MTAGSLEDMYRELASSAGAGTTCAWERVATGPDAPLIVPDGCVDVVWFSDGEPELAGPDTGPRRTVLAEPVEIVGVRLAPGAVRSLLDVPVSEVRDQQVPLADLGDRWRRLSDRLTDGSGTASRADRLRALQEALAAEPRSPADPVVAASVDLLLTGPALRVRDVADRTGISPRQLQRRFDAAVGYGPKTFARVARLQRFLRDVGDAPDLATAAVGAGYASQSHLTDEVRALTSATPVRFLEDRRCPAS